MNDASLTTGGTQGAAIRLERVLPDPPPVVWQALTEPDQLKAWFPCGVLVEGGEWEPGAAISFPFGPGPDAMTLKGEVLEVRKPDALTFTWGEETLRFTLTAQGSGTLLVLVDELSPEAAARNAAGWETCLDLLVTGVADSDAWQPRFEHYSDLFSPTLGAQAGKPASLK
jgi:uncharacterized protein YndB with AHSA1/START domain